MKPETRVPIIAVLIGIVLGGAIGRLIKAVKKYNMATVQQLQTGRTTALEQVLKGAVP